MFKRDAQLVGSRLLYDVTLLVTWLCLNLQTNDVDQKFSGLLEKKWTSVIRLQKKVRKKERA